MSEHSVYPNAPITEALLDIRVELPTEVTLEKLETFHSYIKSRFPEKQAQQQFTTQLKLSSAGQEILPTSTTPLGYRFVSPGKDKIVQARLNGFTFNKLKPYERWEVFRKEAQELWDLYFKLTNCSRITRIALRYINRIELSLPIKDLKEYILTTPEIAPDIAQELTHFFMQVFIRNTDKDATAAITETLQPNTINNKNVFLILDIDVFQERNFLNDMAKMWENFETLRDFKNEVFFKSITKKTEELFL